MYNYYNTYTINEYKNADGFKNLISIYLQRRYRNNFC